MSEDDRGEAHKEIEELTAALDAEREKVQAIIKDTKNMIDVATRSLREELTQLQALVQALVAKLDESDKASQGIFITAAMHGIHYNGPSYADELQALKAATLDATMPATKGGDGE